MAAFAFPSSYLSLITAFSGTKKYIDGANGSNSNNGDSIYTAYATIDYAISANTSATPTMFVIAEGTYTMTSFGTNSSAIRDDGNHREFVCQPGSVVVQWTATAAVRDSAMLQFTNASSKIYGGILKRNNNGRTLTYETAYFISFPGRGNFYNCVFSETNANGAWSYQYDNYGQANIAIRNCTFFNAAQPLGNYSNAGTCLTIDSVFNTGVTTGGTETNVLKSQTVNSTTYQTTGVTTAGVYSGTYAWGQTAIIPAPAGSLFSPAGTTRLLGLAFNSGDITKTGAYTVTTTGSLTFPTIDGVMDTGYATGWNMANNYLRVDDLATVSTNWNKTYCAWYKGTQTASGGSYSPSVPIFADPSNAVGWGLGISAGKICVANGVLNNGTTSVNTGEWFFLAWVVKSNYQVDAYVNGVKELSGITVNSSYPGTSYIGTGYPYAGTESPTALDSIQIFDGTLTDSQILEIYSNTFTTPDATGGTKTTVTENGVTYNIHTFTSSGIFTPNSSFNVDYLVVGGGGGGGGRHGGGGGAGGLLTDVGYAVSYTRPIVVTVGAGATAVNEVAGLNGSSSSINGSYSGIFNNNDKYLFAPASAALEFGSGNFTIEFWWYPTATGRQSLYHGSWGTDYSVGIDYNSVGTNKIGIWASSNGTSWNLINSDGGGAGTGTVTPSQNAWNHVAFVRNGTTWSLYVNGTLSANITGLSGTIVDRSGSQKAIGAWFSTGSVPRASGYISNFRIVKGLAVYTSAFAPPTTPLTTTQSAGTNISAITTQTSLLTLQNATLIDNSTNAFTITNNGSVATDSRSPFGITAIGGGGGAAWPTSVPLVGGSGGGGAAVTTDPGAAGTPGQGFAGGTGLYTAAGDVRAGGGGGGAGAPGTGSLTGPHGGVGALSSINGTSLYYAGGGGGSMWADSVSTGPAGDGGLGGGGGGGSQNRTGVSTAGGAGGGSALNAGEAGTGNTSGTQGYIIGGAGGANTGGGGGAAPQVYSPYSRTGLGGAGGSGVVIFRYVINTASVSEKASGGTKTIISENSPGFTSNYAIHTFLSSSQLYVNREITVEYLVVGGGGGGGNDMGGGGGAGGYVSTSATLAPGNYTITVGAGGTGAPTGSGGTRGSNGGDSKLVPVGFKGNSIYLDGSGDYLLSPSNSAIAVGTGDFTFEAWIYTRSFVTWQMIGGTRFAADNNSATWALGINSSGYMFVYSDGFQATTEAGLIALNNWYHVAVSRSGTTMKIFINGQVKATGTTGQNYTESTFAIGANRNGSEAFNGYISNARLVKGTAVYTADFTPITTPLTAIANTSLLAAQDITIRDNSTNAFSLTTNGNTSISQFTPFTNAAVAFGGGGGASKHDSSGFPASNGGSGGGGSGGRVTNGNYGGNPGLGFPGQGNNGAASGVVWYPGGGGGAGSAASQTGSQIGNGGAGIQNDILGTNYYWAGGGAGGGYSNFGGNGGLGGGGGGAPANGTTLGRGDTNGINPAANATVGTLNAQTNVAAGAGATNTGGGGGGGSHLTGAGGAGGSGIVVIKYLDTIDLAGSGGQGGPNAGGGGGAGNDGYIGGLIPTNIKLFTSSDSMSVTGSGNVEYLVVGGGGGGGNDMGGGGGAGGYQAGTFALNSGSYVVSVGAGGTGAPSGNGGARGGNGGDSAIAPAGFKGNSYSFDGSGDGVHCGDRAAYALGTGAFCLEGWVYNHTIKNYSCLWTTRPDNGAHGGAYHIGWDGAGGASLYVGTTGFAGIPAGSIQAGQWQHIAVSRNSAGNLAFFVNGVRLGYTASFTTNFTNSILGLGDFPTTKAESIHGYISNARIVSGAPVYDPTQTTCTVPTQPLTAIAGTVILTAQDTTFVDNSTNAFTITANGDVATSKFTPFGTLAISSVGGGGGASRHDTNTNPAGFGASGGGASGQNANRGLGIPGQGNAGSNSNGQWYPGGGGGASAAGATAPAHGGAGIQNDILGTSYYWSGGGGGGGYTGYGGNGGLGGGGGGAPANGTTLGRGDTNGINPAANGTVGILSGWANVPGGAGGANTGGGGGGGSHNNVNNFGGAGGSGIVAIKYNSLDLTITGGIDTTGYEVDTMLGGGYGASGSGIGSGTPGAIGGGGGGASSTTVAGGGGGVGLSGHYWIGGAAGLNEGDDGEGGSYGLDGVNGNGGLYGGGGGGTTNAVVDNNVGNGARGALKIFWQGQYLQFPYPVLADNTPSISYNPPVDELATETATMNLELSRLQADVKMQSTATSNWSNVYRTGETGIISHDTYSIQKDPITSSQIVSNELKISTQAIDLEMMIVNSDKNNIATWDDVTKYQTIEQITYENDPRRVTVRLLNFIVGVTGEDGDGGTTVSSVQVWF